MKNDKTANIDRQLRQIVLTDDRTSRPEKVLFFADPHFLFFKSRPHLAHCLLPDTQANASQKSKSQIFPTHKLKVSDIKF